MLQQPDTDDKEPWIHSWPNERREEIRSEKEHCTVDGCTATYAPRSKDELQAIWEARQLSHKPWWVRARHYVEKYWKELKKTLNLGT